MKKTILLSTLLFGFTTFGQQEVIIIDKGAYKERKEKEIKLNDNTQVLKFAPLNMMVGEINFSYEKQTSQKGSFELGIGPTLSKIGFGVDTHIFDTPSVTENSGLGFFTSVAYRFYPLDETEALNRFYVSPILKFKLLNYSYQDNNTNLGSVKASDNRLDFYFNFGYQVWAAKSFSLDFYGGIGLGYRTTEEYRVESTYTSSGEWVNKWVMYSVSGARYIANLGLKIGIGWE